MLKARFGFSGTRCSQCSGFWVHLGEKVRVFGYTSARKFGFLGTRSRVSDCFIKRIPLLKLTFKYLTR